MHKLVQLQRLAFWMAVTVSPFLTSGCTPGANVPILQDHRPEAYLLDRGDEVRIITYDEDQLTGDFRLNDQGNLALPLLGVIHAGGMSSERLSNDITNQLKNKHIIVNPSVSVEVRNYRPVFVLGEVAKPGQYPYQPGMTMLTAVAVAGGFTYRAITNHALDIRTTGSRSETGRVLPDSFIAPGDVISVYERYF